MKKWKIIKIITIVFIILFILRIITNLIVCLNMEYPHPMLGIDAYNWTDQFLMDLYFTMYVLGIPLIIDIILLIISLKKTKNNKRSKNE